MRAEVPVPLIHELWRRLEIKGAAVRLDAGPGPVLDAPALETSRFAASDAPCLPWRVTGNFPFRRTFRFHINLQDARALKREIFSTCSDSRNLGSIQVVLNDLMVVVGDFSKGRSSSFRLNGILRSMLPFLTYGDVALALDWIETGANLADWPSRFKPLPPRPWMTRFGLERVRDPLGWEIFVGSC